MYDALKPNGVWLPILQRKCKESNAKCWFYGRAFATAPQEKEKMLRAIKNSL